MSSYQTEVIGITPPKNHAKMLKTYNFLHLSTNFSGFEEILNVFFALKITPCHQEEKIHLSCVCAKKQTLSNNKNISSSFTPSTIVDRCKNCKFFSLFACFFGGLFR